MSYTRSKPVVLFWNMMGTLGSGASLKEIVSLRAMYWPAHSHSQCFDELPSSQELTRDEPSKYVSQHHILFMSALLDTAMRKANTPTEPL